MQPPLILLFPTCTLIKTTLGVASIVSSLLGGMKLYNLLLFARDLMLKFQTNCWQQSQELKADFVMTNETCFLILSEQDFARIMLENFLNF